jgi:hypothetical protein
MATPRGKGSGKGAGEVSKGSSRASAQHDNPTGDNILIGDHAQKLFVKAGTIGVVAFAISVLLGMTTDFRAFQHSYLVAFMWTLSLGLGALWWVTLQHLVNARWSVAIRRVGELLAANMSVLIPVLALPIVVPAILGNSSLFPWVDSARMHADHALHHKTPYLNAGFFAVRFVVFFLFWAVLANYLLVRSVRHDQQGRQELLSGMARISGPAMIFIGLTLTFTAIDFLMSLDPMWFSTIFGVYYFAGTVLAIHSAMALTLMWLQKKGRLVKSVSVEHYHDIGKMMFAFTVFWAYIAFSQFMLIWYANIPEETAWYKERFEGAWAGVSWLLLIAHFVIPFFGLLSRHVKRNKKFLAFWAFWLLAVHYLDLYWLVKPNLGTHHIPFNIMDITCLVALASLFIAGAAHQARKVSLIPTKDPRLAQSLAFENV